MMDFFTSLVDRALDRTPVLERRQPTLFEPLTEAAAAFGAQSVGNVSPLQENEIVIDSTDSSDPQPNIVDKVSRLSQLSPQREETKPQPVETRPAPAPSFHLSPNRQSERDNATPEPLSRASTKEPAKTVRASKAGAETRLPSITQEITVAPLRTIETIIERRIEREVVTEHSTEKPAIKEVQTFARENPQLKPAAALDGDTGQKHSAKAVVKSPRPAKEQTIKPLMEKKSVARPDSMPNVRTLPRVDSRQARRQSTPPPSVHVTIGRVEVRATPAATGKYRVAQPVGPKTTLEDYLRSRGEGN